MKNITKKLRAIELFLFVLKQYGTKLLYYNMRLSALEHIE